MIFYKILRSISPGFFLILLISALSTNALAKRNTTNTSADCLSKKQFNQIAKSSLVELQSIDSSLTLTDVKLVMKSAGNCASMDELTAIIHQYGLELMATTEPANTPPVISGTANSSITEGASYMFTPISSDADNDNLFFSVDNLPAWANFDVTTGAILGVPMHADIGLYENISITVSDGNTTNSLSGININVIAAPDIQSPTAPGNLLSTDVTAEQVSMSWTQSTDNIAVSGYRVYRDGVLLNSTSLNSFNDASVNDNTSYQYQVVAYDAANNTATSNVLNVTTLVAADIQSPTAPGNLLSTDVTAEQVSMSWTQSTDNIAVSGYRIYRDGVLLNSTSLHSFNDASVNDNTSYQYQVVAYDAANNTATSNVLNVTTLVAADTQSPTAPGNLLSTDVTAEQVSMSWTQSTDNIAVSGYRIYRDGVLLNSTSLNSFTDASVNDNTSYQYQVEAYDAADNTATSNVLNVTTLAASDIIAPSTPASLSLINVTTNQASFSWAASTDNTDVVGYRIYKNYSNTFFASTTSLNFTDPGLTPAQTYVYAVTAIDAAGNESSQSAYISIDTEAVVATPSVSLSWQAPTQNTDDSCMNDIQGYAINYGASSGDYSASLNLDLSGGDVMCVQTDFDNVCGQPVMTCSYTLDSLDAGVWYFAIQTIDSLGVRSGHSNEGSKLVN